MLLKSSSARVFMCDGHISLLFQLRRVCVCVCAPTRTGGSICSLCVIARLPDRAVWACPLCFGLGVTVVTSYVKVHLCCCIRYKRFKSNPGDPQLNVILEQVACYSLGQGLANKQTNKQTVADSFIITVEILYDYAVVCIWLYVRLPGDLRYIIGPKWQGITHICTLLRTFWAAVKTFDNPDVRRARLHFTFTFICNTLILIA